MRLMPGIASTGPWYVVVPIRILFGLGFLFLLFRPYVLVPELRLDTGAAWSRR